MCYVIGLHLGNGEKHVWVVFSANAFNGIVVTTIQANKSIVGIVSSLSSIFGLASAPRYVKHSHLTVAGN